MSRGELMSASPHPPPGRQLQTVYFYYLEHSPTPDGVSGYLGLPRRHRRPRPSCKTQRPLLGTVREDLRAGSSSLGPEALGPA